MKFLLLALGFLFQCPNLGSETVHIHGELSLCLTNESGTTLVLNSLTYEPQSMSEQSQLWQSLAKQYRQNGSLKVLIESKDFIRQQELQKGCHTKSSPFSIAQGQIGILRIKAEVEPESVKITWLDWLEAPVLSVPLQRPAFKISDSFGSLSHSKAAFETMFEPLSQKTDPKAYPPGGTGYGNVTFDNGDSYSGYFKNYRFEGKGIYRWKNGNTHDGNFSAGLRHGSGVWTVLGQSRWVGNWISDSLEGYGQTFYNNGEKYQGNFSNWQAHGQGKWTWPNGQYYEGSFQYGHFAGSGTMVFADGAKYVGNWVQSKRTGYGVMTYANGDHYSGSWLKDRYHGQGKYTGKDWWYEGNFINGQRSGQGTQESYRTRYVGLWENDQMHGNGVLTDKKEGTVWETTWLRGNLLGEYVGVITVSAGHRFVGVFQDLAPKQGKVTFTNQDTYEGNFVNGMFHGRGKYTFYHEDIVIEDEFIEDSCLLSLEGTLKRLQISMGDDDFPLPATALKDGLFPEITAAFSAEDNYANDSRAPVAVVLLPFLKKVAAATTVGYLRVSSQVRFLTFTKSVAAFITKYRSGPGTGIIYYREDTRKLEPDLFLYVGKTINVGNYECRQQVHNRVYKKLHPQHSEFNFKEFETHIDILDPVFKLKEQSYIQQCESAIHPLCFPHGPNHLANKINSIGMRGFENWKANNPLEWALIESTCGLWP